MKSAIAKQWIAALRSGKYEQGKHILKDAHGAYCVLGVLQGPVLGLPSTASPLLSGKERVAAGMHSSSGQPAPPTCLRGIEIRGEDYRDLAHANDSGVSFSAIADWIEDNHASL